MNYVVNISGMNDGVMTFHLWRKFDYAVQSDSGTKTCFDAQDQVEYSKGFQDISDNWPSAGGINSAGYDIFSSTRVAGSHLLWRANEKIKAPRLVKQSSFDGT